MIVLVLGLIVVVTAVNLVIGFLNGTGASAVWLWQSVKNLFRKEKREVINPFTKKSNFDNVRQSDDLSYTPTEVAPKRYEPTDGEVIEYEELP